MKCGSWEMWPEDRMERLAELWNAGELSAAQIGRELGVSRNAVLGKVHRSGLGPSNRVIPKSLGPARIRKPRVFSKPRPQLVIDNTGQVQFIRAEPVKPVLRPGQTKTSASYRSQFGHAPEMTANQRRAFLAEVFRNTAEASV